MNVEIVMSVELIRPTCFDGLKCATLHCLRPPESVVSILLKDSYFVDIYLLGCSFYHAVKSDFNRPKFQSILFFWKSEKKKLKPNILTIVTYVATFSRSQDYFKILCNPTSSNISRKNLWIL